MLYCPPNTTFSEVWVNHGFNVCFYNTVTTSIVSCFIFVFGLIQFRLYWRYSTLLDDAVVLPKNWLFKAQVFGQLTLVSLAVFEIIARHSVYKEQVYGYELVDLFGVFIIWPFSIGLLLLERNYQLPSSPGLGHGAVLLITWTLALVAEVLDLLSLNNEDWFFNLENVKDKVEFGFWIGRFILTIAVFALGLKAPGLPRAQDFASSDQEAMLPGQGRRQASASQGSTWRGFWRKLRILLPYMWPKKSLGLQLRVLLCFIVLIGARVANVVVPMLYKEIVDALGVGTFCWQIIVGFVCLKMFQGGAGNQGMLYNIRAFLWIRVQQYTTREIQVELFRHLHSLSLRWHLTRKTGEVLRIMDRGTSSINSLLSYLVFNILPTIIDIIVAIIYFTAAFNVWFGLIVLVTMALYLAMTISVTEWRTKYRRKMNLADNEQRMKGVDSLLNFETVKYYGAESYEIDRYEKAIVDYQVEEWKSLASLTLLNTCQTLVSNGGLLAGSLYCGYLVADKSLTVGDYVLFGTYILQLMVPLNFLGTLYRVIQESFINMENMLDLLNEEQEVKDLPNALPIVVSDGKIEFKNVTFHYAPERVILKDISFMARPGETIALVGPTGSGKSTIIRLLFRFYDVQQGEVLIDGQNIEFVTQASVRRAIGVVPQDTVLFNDTISYNIRYGRQSASEEDIKAAATHADIHERIVTFPEQYETKVGERGLKLSGGEKQRVAIARTLLKAPNIVLLDEATSALDTQTERNIQTALNTVCKDRTTVIVAHRLSTITHADCILVLKDGEIIERGRHEDLLREQGTYFAMWNQQSQSQDQEVSDDITSKED